MSQGNAEVVRDVWRRFNRDGALPETLFDPEVEVFNARETPLPGPYRGYDGLRRWREVVFEVLEEGRYEVGDVVEVDDADVVVYRLRLLGRARHTGIGVDVGWTMVSWFREGRIHCLKAFTSHSEAL